MKNLHLILLQFIFILGCFAQTPEITFNYQKTKGELPNKGNWAWKTEEGYSAITANMIMLKYKIKYIKFDKKGGQTKVEELDIKDEDGNEMIIGSKFPIADKVVFLGYAQKIKSKQQNYYLIEFTESTSGINYNLKKIVNVYEEAYNIGAGAHHITQKVLNAQFGFSPDSNRLVVQLGTIEHEMASIQVPIWMVFNLPDLSFDWHYIHKTISCVGLNPILLNDGTVVANVNIDRKRSYELVKEAEVQILELQNGELKRNIKLKNPMNYFIYGSSLVHDESDNSILVVGTYLNKKGVFGLASMKLEEGLIPDKWNLQEFSALNRKILLPKNAKPEEGYEGICTPQFIKRLPNGTTALLVNFVVSSQSKTSNTGIVGTTLIMDASMLCFFDSSGKATRQIAIESKWNFQAKRSYYLFILDEYALMNKNMLPFVNGNKVGLLFNCEEQWLDEKVAQAGKNPVKKDKWVQGMILVDDETGEIARKKIKVSNPNNDFPKCSIVVGYNYEYTPDMVLFNSDFKSGYFNVAQLKWK